jgi:hypothetical protein
MSNIRAVSALLTLLAAGAANAQYVLGHIGETLQPTRIFASPSAHSRTYCRLSAYVRVIINPGPNGYDKVLLRNGVYGYTPESAIAQLPYKLVSRTPPRPEISGESRAGSAIANYGLQFQGVPYKMGGTDTSTGIDCSAFVQKLYGDVAGVKLPRTAAEQALVGEPITRLEYLQPGDRLYFWDKNRGKIGHTGVYIGGGMFVHSSHGRGGVATNYLSQSWLRTLVAARRGA